jgi:hypothetical protein
MLWIVRLAMWCVPFGTLRHRLDARRNSLARRGVASRRGDLSRVVRQLNLASRFVPLCNCLVRALVAEQLLAESGHTSLLRYGMSGATDSGSTAHAWIECEGRVLVGGDVSRFVAFQPADTRLPL